MTDSSTPGWLHLSDDEEVVWESRPHPIEIGVEFPIGIGLLIGGFLLVGGGGSNGLTGPVTLLGILIGFIGGALVAIRYLIWANTRYVITSKELYKKRGVITRDVTQFRLDRIQNTSLQQGVPGRLLGYGDLTIYTAGSGDPELTFERTPRPERANSVLNDALGSSARLNEA